MVFWDLFGESGHPIRTTISEMPPLLLYNLLELNDTQEGVPGFVEDTLIRPPTSRIGPLTPGEREEIRERSPVGARYDESLDRESAAEVLQKRADEATRKLEQAEKDQKNTKAPKPRKRSSNRQTPTEAAIKSFLRSASTTLGREIMRGIFGAMRKGSWSGRTRHCCVFTTNSKLSAVFNRFVVPAIHPEKVMNSTGNSADRMPSACLGRRQIHPESTMSSPVDLTQPGN